VFIGKRHAGSGSGFPELLFYNNRTRILVSLICHSRRHIEIVAKMANMNFSVGDKVFYRRWQMEGEITELYKPLGTFLVAKVLMVDLKTKDCFLHEIERLENRDEGRCKKKKYIA
jgi:hypothetical protein